MATAQRTPAFCTQCRSRCGCVAVVEDGKLLGIDPLPDHPTGEKLCPKGRAAPELVYHPDRLTHPLRRTSPKGESPATWERISWDAVLAEIAGRMARIRDAHGPEQVAFSVTTPSGSHISDSIPWIERFIRGFGAANTIYATEICNWHKDFASRFTYGTDIGTPDFANTDCVLLWGHNPAATWLARSVEIQKARRRGAKLITVDPRPAPFARRADCWLQVRPGTDQALALGLAHLLLSTDRFDRDFVREWTNATFLVRADTGRFLRERDRDPGGSSEVLLARGADPDIYLRYDASAGQWIDDSADAALFGEASVALGEKAVVCRSALALFADAAAAFPPERVAGITGVAPEALAQAAAILAESPTVAYYAWNGIGQSVTATQTDRALSILYSLTGSYGAAGGNVPGAAAPVNDISGLDLVTDAQRAKTLGLAERPLGPARHGWVTARDVYRAITHGDPYPIRMLFSFGTNLLASQPDPEPAKTALRALEFHVHADFFVNASAAYADILLPVATSWEREGLRNGFDASLEGLRRVQLRPAVIAPIGETRSDTDIVMDLAARLGMSETMFGGDADAGFAHMLAPSGISLDNLRECPEGVAVAGTVPLAAYRSQGFPTPSKRVEIYSEQMVDHGFAPIPALVPATDPEHERAGLPLRLSSAKTMSFCHSQHRNIPSLRRLTPDPILELAPSVAADRGIVQEDWVEVTTAAGRFIARAKIDPKLTGDAVFAQHGWGVSDTGDAPNLAGDPLAASINVAIPTQRADPVSGSIPLRNTWCEVRKV